MKFTAVVLAVFFGFVGTAVSQNIAFTIESDLVKLPGNEVINRDNFQDNGFNFTVYGSSISNLSTLAGLVEDFQFNLGSNPVGAVSSLFSASEFSSGWGEIAVSPGTGPFASLDWRGTINDFSPGSVPVMMILSRPIDQITENDFIGLVSTSSVTVPTLGTETIGFTSGTSVDSRWNVFSIGSEGSITLQAVPEPSTYALIAGLGVLGFVLIRRRMRR